MDGILERPFKVSISRYRDFKNLESSNNTLDESIADELIDMYPETSAMQRMAKDARSKYKRLSESDVRKLIKEAQDGNLNSLNYLQETYLLVSFHVLRKYFSAHEYEEDLILEGYNGIRNAILKFDLEKTNQLSTFMYRVVISSMHNFLKKMNPHMVTTPPSIRLRKVISTTDLNNLLTNFESIEDLKQRIEKYSKPIQQLIIEYVLDRYVKVISFEQYEEEILEYIHNDTLREFVDSPNWDYMFQMENFYRCHKETSLLVMDENEFDTYCLMKGLYGYDLPIDNEKTLQQLGISSIKYNNLCQKMVYKVFDDEEFRYEFKELVKNVIEARGYYYERI